MVFNRFAFLVILLMFGLTSEGSFREIERTIERMLPIGMDIGLGL